MTNYYFRHTGVPHTYMCAKFLPDDPAPVDIYKVRLEQHHIKGGPIESFACSCPAYKLDCKHVTMLREWVLRAQPDRVGLYFDDTTQTWEHDAVADFNDLTAKMGELNHDR